MQPANHHPPIQRSSGSYTNSISDERVPPVFDVGPAHVPPPDREGRKLDNLWSEFQVHVFVPLASMPHGHGSGPIPLCCCCWN
ncbi:hypothetical protein V6N13_013486 [Hibiscus sabdariffa]|uniref:Uncharacterized protein n=2 Tax=Hibiscus sabdariffa TaxID=183260 RepID=A0ABR2P227_9ROSI